MCVYHRKNHERAVRDRRRVAAETEPFRDPRSRSPRRLGRSEPFRVRRGNQSSSSSSSPLALASLACFSACAWASNLSNSNLSYRYSGTFAIST